LEKQGSLIPPMPAKDLSAVARVPPDAGGVILLRSALEYGLRSPWMVMTKTRNRELSDR
jgi:hypothetical protein